jgi:two-component system, NtrC family, response regulator HydG
MSTAPHPARVLLVGHEGSAADRMRTTLAPRFACEIASSSESALAVFGSDPFDVVVANDIVDGSGGLDLLETIHRQSPNTAFILMGEPHVARAMEAGKRGAYDYLVRSSDDVALAGCLDRAFSEIGARRAGVRDPKSARELSEPIIIGGSAALAETLDAVDRVAHSAAPVLLVGETGTGKDVLAARIHARGPRRHRPYIVVNAAAIPAALLDSELFGHVAGAFTGATRARRGLIAEADGGTLLLDEIGDLPIELQGRLLRVVELGLIRAVGADHERSVDVRFLAATHNDLSHAVRDGRFREDLYFRLNVLAIGVPPLRDRREDVPALVDYFFERARARNPRSPVREISRDALAQLIGAAWPGNVRELQGFVERLVVLGKGERVEMQDVAILAQLSTALPPVSTGPLESLRAISTRHVESVLTHTNGDKPRAAAILGIDVSTLYRWQRQRLDG